MKYIITLTTIIIATVSMAAETKKFTALGNGDNSVYVSVKKSSKETGAESKLFELDDKSKKEIKLPTELQERDIVGIFSHKKRLFIISQMTTEQGDNPVLYENINNKWSKIKEVNCKNFSKIEIEKNTVTFNCEMEDHQKTIQKSEAVKIKNLAVDKKITIPQTEIKDAKFSAKLEGTPFEWDKIRVQNSHSKDFNVSEF